MGALEQNANMGSQAGTVTLVAFNVYVDTTCIRAYWEKNELTGCPHYVEPRVLVGCIALEYVGEWPGVSVSFNFYNAVRVCALAVAGPPCTVQRETLPVMRSLAGPNVRSPRGVHGVICDASAHAACHEMGIQRGRRAPPWWVERGEAARTPADRLPVGGAGTGHGRLLHGSQLRTFTGRSEVARRDLFALPDQSLPHR